MRDGEALRGLVKTLHFIGEETEAQERRDTPRQAKGSVGGGLAPYLMLSYHPAGLAGYLSCHPCGP